MFGSAFFFYLATLIIRWAKPHVTIEAAYFVFAQLLLGFIVVCAVMILKQKRPQPKKYPYLIGRALANTLAVFCFYKAVESGSVAEANILNMTYPLFVALFSWLFLLSCSVAGVLGQHLITYGFLYVTAEEDSIISSSRILLAALLGPILVADPALTIAGWCGALLIFSANATLALRKI